MGIKIYLLRRAAEEIREAFTDRLSSDTNTLIDVSCRDRQIRRLAETINVQLRILRKERRRFMQGDLELKEAVTNISHDLRTPLTAICGYLDLLEQEQESETAERYLEIISSRAENMKQLTEELFCYCVVTAASGDASAGDMPSMEETSLNHVLEESISAYYAALKERCVIPDISMPECQVMRRLDRKALCRIFGNILGNTIKYSDGDLQVHLSEDGEIVFSNHATGLDKIQVGKLFDRFYTVENARNSTGLGLSIAKALTEQMNGSIQASYREGILSIRICFPKM